MVHVMYSDSVILPKLPIYAYQYPVENIAAKPLQINGEN